MITSVNLFINFWIQINEIRSEIIIERIELKDETLKTRKLCMQIQVVLRAFMYSVMYMCQYQEVNA